MDVPYASVLTVNVNTPSVQERHPSKCQRVIHNGREWYIQNFCNILIGVSFWCSGLNLIGLGTWGICRDESMKDYIDTPMCAVFPRACIWIADVPFLSWMLCGIIVGIHTCCTHSS